MTKWEYLLETIHLLAKTTTMYNNKQQQKRKNKNKRQKTDFGIKLQIISIR